MKATPTAMTKMTSAIFIHANTLDAVTMPDPVIQPLEPSISRLAELAMISAPIDSTTGQVANTIPFDQRLFENYWHTNHSEQRGIGVKWALNPQKNMGYQWHLHRTFGPNKFTDFIGFGHYLAMNTSWSWKRDEFLGDSSSLVELPEIKENLMTWKAKRG